jgi:hypothetical protein
MTAPNFAFKGALHMLRASPPLFLFVYLLATFAGQCFSLQMGGRSELFQNHSLSAHKLRRGVIRRRTHPMKACQKE